MEMSKQIWVHLQARFEPTEWDSRPIIACSSQKKADNFCEVLQAEAKLKISLKAQFI